MSLSELIAQREALARQQAELEKSIAEAQASTKRDVVAQIKALMADHGLTISDLASESKGRGKGKSSEHGNAGNKVAPKYRDSATGATWTGRGLKPNWLRSALEEGRSLEEFLIAA